MEGEERIVRVIYIVKGRWDGADGRIDLPLVLDIIIILAKVR